MFNSLQDELVVDDVYLRILVRDAERQKAVGGDGDARKAAASMSGLGQGLTLPVDLLVREREIERDGMAYFNMHLFHVVFSFFFGRRRRYY